MKNVSSIIFLAVQLLLFCSSIYSFAEAFDVNLLGEPSETPRERFQMMRAGGQSVYSGSIDIGRNATIYELDEIPPEIQVLTVAFAGRYSPCENVGCGDLDKIFVYRGQKDKQRYLDAVNRLRQKNPNIIILFEVNDKILYNEHVAEAFQNMDKLLNFIEEFEFDGLNFRINVHILEDLGDTKKPDRLLFYYNYLNDFTNKMKNGKLLALTLNLNGAICNKKLIDNSKLIEVKGTDTCPPLLIYPQAETYCNIDLKDFMPLSPNIGSAIPLLTRLKSKIDMVVVFEEMYYMPETDSPPLVDFYQSYLNFADAYGFAVHVGFEVSSKKMPLRPENTPVLEKLTSEMSKENKAHSRGDGISILNLGCTNMIFDENEVIKKFKNMLP